MNIVTCYPASKGHLDQIRQTAPGARILACPLNQLPQLLPEADIFLGHAKIPVDWEAVVTAGRLKWIQSTAAGLDHCLTPPVVESPVIVTSASGLFAQQVAEHTLALLYGLLRRLHEFIGARPAKLFRRLPTDDLQGKRVALVGAGGNGQRIAQLLAPVACPIEATDCFHEQTLPGIHRLRPPDELSSMLAQSDIVIITVPWTPQTDRLIAEDQLACMPAGSYLINVGRGRVLCETALIEALQSGHLVAAGLDVVDQEPLPAASPLWDLPNVIITPHVAAQSASRIDDVTRFFCGNLQRFLHDRPLINRVDKRMGFPRPEDRYRIGDPF